MAYFINLCLSNLETTQMRTYLTVLCVDRGNLVSVKVHFTHVQRGVYILTPINGILALQSTDDIPEHWQYRKAGTVCLNSDKSNSEVSDKTEWAEAWKTTWYNEEEARIGLSTATPSLPSSVVSGPLRSLPSAWVLTSAWAPPLQSHLNYHPGTPKG